MEDSHKDLFQIVFGPAPLCFARALVASVKLTFWHRGRSCNSIITHKTKLFLGEQLIYVNHLIIFECNDHS